jgi:hypothetical protein
MKKIFSLLFVVTLITACGSLEELLELNVNNDLTESIDVHIPQTQGSAVAYDKTETVDLNTGDFAEYVGKISAIKINTLTYKFKEFAGNRSGTVPSGSLKFDNILVAEMTDFNISQAATAGTVFNITDAAVLSQIETALLNNNAATIKLSGSVLSDAGAMDFKVEVFMNMTATIKE